MGREVSGASSSCRQSCARGCGATRSPGRPPRGSSAPLQHNPIRRNPTARRANNHKRFRCASARLGIARHAASPGAAARGWPSRPPPGQPSELERMSEAGQLMMGGGTWMTFDFPDGIDNYSYFYSRNVARRTRLECACLPLIRFTTRRRYCRTDRSAQRCLARSGAVTSTRRECQRDLRGAGRVDRLRRVGEERRRYRQRAL